MDRLDPFQPPIRSSHAVAEPNTLHRPGTFGTLRQIAKTPIIEPVVLFLLLFRRYVRPVRAWAGFALLLTLSIGLQTRAQAVADAANAGKNRILLVLPFDNGTGQPN